MATIKIKEKKKSTLNDKGGKKYFSGLDGQMGTAGASNIGNISNYEGSKKYPSGVGGGKKTPKQEGEESRKARAERFKDTSNVDKKINTQAIQAKKNEYGMPDGDQKNKLKKVGPPRFRFKQYPLGGTPNVGTPVATSSTSALKARKGVKVTQSIKLKGKNNK